MIVSYIGRCGRAAYRCNFGVSHVLRSDEQVRSTLLNFDHPLVAPWQEKFEEVEW